MNKPEEYRECAAECLRLAQRTAARQDKVLLQSMADRWLGLAKKTERRLLGIRLVSSEAEPGESRKAPCQSPLLGLSSPG
jgi:hypothetical protein